MSGVFELLGFKEGSSYTFNEDSTYTATIGSRTTQKHLQLQSGYEGADNEDAPGHQDERDGIKKD